MEDVSIKTRRDIIKVCLELLATVNDNLAPLSATFPYYEALNQIANARRELKSEYLSLVGKEISDM